MKRPAQEEVSKGFKGRVQAKTENRQEAQLLEQHGIASCHITYNSVTSVNHLLMCACVLTAAVDSRAKNWIAWWGMMPAKSASCASASSLRAAWI